MDALRSLVEIDGRISRACYWRAVFFLLGVLMSVSLLAVFAGAALHGRASVDVSAAFAALSIPVSVRRLHDRGKSGLWLIAFFLLPEPLDRVVDIAPAGFDFALALISAGLSVWAFIELGCLRGAAGSNRFGSDPLASGSTLQ